MVQYAINATGTFYPLSFVPTTLSLSESSSSFTEGNNFAVNEIFRIQSDHMIPVGEHDIIIVASKVTMQEFMHII